MTEQVIIIIGSIIDIAGVSIIALGIIYAIIKILLSRSTDTLLQKNSFTIFRQYVGNAILLGLEFLVAGDIIRTVAVKPDLQSVAILGAVVVIRTFLSFSLDVEMTGKLPWRKNL